jgi:hypothetical protein
VLGRQTTKDRQVRTATIGDGVSKGCGVGKQLGRRQRDRGRDRKIGVSDVVEAVEDPVDALVGTAHCDPGQFELGQADALGEAAEGAAEAVLDRRKARVAAGAAFDWVGQKHLVRDQRPTSLPAEAEQSLAIFRVDKGPGRVVGVDHDDRSDGHGEPLEGGKIDAPFRLGVEGVGGRLDAVKARKVVEQRVGRCRNQHPVARIAKEAEEEAVGLTGGGCEEDVAGIDLGALSSELLCDGEPRHHRTPWVGFVS